MSGQLPENADPKKPRGKQMMGPGLALAILAGTGLYAVSAHVGADAPAAAAPAAQAPRVAAPTPAARVAAPGPAVPGGRPAASAVQAPSRAEPPPTEALEPAEAERQAVRQAARQYRAGRFNAFFRKEAFIEELSREGTGPKIAALKQELADPTALQQLPANTQFLEAKPEPVLERMAMIDMLFELAPSDPTARDAMTSLALSPIDRGLPDSVKKGLVGEKYDLLFRLAQVDRRLAVDTYTKLESQKLKNLLLEALVAGLSESGATPDEVRRIVASL